MVTPRLRALSSLEPRDEGLVPLLGEPFDDILGDDRANAVYLRQLHFSRFCKCIYRTKFIGKQYRSLLPHLRNGEPDEKPRKLDAVGFLDRRDEFLGRDIGKAFEREQVAFGQCKKLVVVLDETLFEQLVHSGRSEPLDIERVLAHKIVKTAADDRKRILVHTAPRGSARHALDAAVAAALLDICRPFEFPLFPRT